MSLVLSSQTLALLSATVNYSPSSLPPADVSPQATARSDWLDRAEFTVHHNSSSHHMVEWASKIGREIERETERKKKCHYENNKQKWPQCWTDCVGVDL